MKSHKRCTKCKILKSVSEFSKNKTRPDGLQYYCKICSVGPRICKICKKPREYKKHYCQECATKLKLEISRKAKKDWKKRNPEKRRDYQRERRKDPIYRLIQNKKSTERMAHKYRTDPEYRKKTLNASKERKTNKRLKLLRLIAYMQGIPSNICQGCGIYGKMEIDHLKPRIMGGSDHPINLIPLCRTCNQTKNMFWTLGKLRHENKRLGKINNDVDLSTLWHKTHTTIYQQNNELYHLEIGNYKMVDGFPSCILE